MLYITLTILVAVASTGLASPVPGPEPGSHHTRVKIYVPEKIRKIHHHHVEKIPVIKEVPIIKTVPIYKEVPVYKTVPIVQTVSVPVVHTVPVEKNVYVPVPVPIKEPHLGWW